MKLGRTGKRKVRGGGFARPVHELSPEERRERRVFYFSACLAFAVLVASLTRSPQPQFDEFTEDIETEVIAQRTWKAEFAFESVDLTATEKAAEEAAQKVADTYYADQASVESQIDELRLRIGALRDMRPQVDEAIRTALLESNSSQSANPIIEDTLAQLAARLVANDPRFAGVKTATALALWMQPEPDCVPERVFATAPQRSDRAGASREAQPDAPQPVETLAEPALTPFIYRYDMFLEEIATDALSQTLSFGVFVPEASPLRAAPADDRTVLIVRNAPHKTDQMRWGDVPRASRAFENLHEAVYTETRELEERLGKTEAFDATALQSAAFELASLGVVNTVVFDRVATEGAREAARQQVLQEPIMRTVERGKVIQRDGDYWTEQSRLDVKTYLAQVRQGDLPTASLLGSALSHMLLAGLSLAMLIQVRPVISGRKPAGYKALILVMLIMVSTVLVARLVSYFEPTGYVVPVGAAAILIAILVNARAALLAGFLCAGLVSIVFEYSWGVLVVACTMTFAGVASIFKVRRRSDMTRSAVQATFLGLITMLAINLGTDAAFNEMSLQRMGLILLNGLAISFLVPGLLSPLERLFGITTDIQLLEYSDLNNEVLSKLAIEIPATYAHSLMLGQLAEAACDAIGANGLLARVCAYYHDIGKMKRPDYFSENQTGVNIHDGLPPRLSARAIAAHVIEGAEMARDYHLPQPIIDGIYEHHGTNLIGYFYQQALQQNKHGDVREEDFRYPGPKPRSRETAILMICDAVESGVRSIKNPNEERVREFVDKIIGARAEDRQFDDCDLTLKDLDTIAEVVSRRMWTAMHSRVAYPERQQEKRAANVVPLSGGKEQ